MTISVSVSIDVPSLAEGIAFYCAAFGFSKKSEPVPGVAVLGGLQAKREQVFENPEHGSAAFCSDPFGHGFCLIARKAKQ